MSDNPLLVLSGTPLLILFYPGFRIDSPRPTYPYTPGLLFHNGIIIQVWWVFVKLFLEPRLSFLFSQSPLDAFYQEIGTDLAEPKELMWFFLLRLYHYHRFFWYVFMKFSMERL